MKIKVLFLTLAMALILAACGGMGGSADAPDLNGTAWVLAKVGSNDILPGSSSTLFFKDGKLGGNASCNQMFGGYTQNGSALKFDQLGSTMMACDFLDQETKVFEALPEVTSFKIVDGQLQLLNASGAALLIYAPQDTSLEGKDWELVSYNNLQGIYSLIADTKITATFKDGQVTGSSGCNNYFSDYKINKDQVTFGPVGATEMACPTPNGVMQQEQDFFRALQASVSYRIDGTRLTFYDSEGRIALEFVPAYK